MLFHTPEFLLIVLLPCLTLYFLFPKIRLYVLTFFNALFYSFTGLDQLLLFICVVIITYFIGKKLHQSRRKSLLILGITGNALNLIYFKYSLFIAENLAKFHLFPGEVSDSFVAQIVLPIGISFYTFKMIAYLVDVYRGEIQACNSLIHFWVFVSFFAQLVAGPIMRGKEYLPQIEAVPRIRVSPDQFKLGVFFITLGLVKKVVFADHLAPIVDRYFNDVGIIDSTVEAWVASHLYAFQIYFDFSAYSDMAVGIGYLFGLSLNFNFLSPYVSKNPTEFWSRWHITLSSWIRDYIYIPLGGSRKGRARQLINLLLTMLISGIWHGAAWTFVLWGLLHGLLLVLHKLWLSLKARLSFPWNHLVVRVISYGIFLHVITCTWVFFRANSVTDAFTMLGWMFRFENMGHIVFFKTYSVLLLFLLALHHVEYWIREHLHTLGTIWHRALPPLARGICYVAVVFIIISFMTEEKNAFIYFQF